MSIKKDVYIPVLQGKTHTVNSEGKNELSDATNEVLDKIYFRVIDDNRKVNVGTTALLIYEIKKWLKSYKEKIIPNILEPTNPSLEKEKNKIYRDTIAWVEKWEHWKEVLIPENRGVIGGVDLEVDRFHFVKLNDKLLDPNKSLTYSQALFLLLGLNAIALDNELADFPEYATFTGTMPTGRYSKFDFIFWNTPQNQALRTSAFVDGGKITSENLLKLADKYDFFTKQDERLQNRNIAKKVAEKLHRLLKEANYITGKFNEIWQWEANRNQLSYLAKQLSQKRILKGECHKELANYIQDPSKAKRPLGNIKNPANTETIDSIIKQLIT